MASRGKRARRLAGSDGIFRLPEEILQKIFFLLPVEDAVSLSATSKTWRNAWTSLPVLNLRFDHDENVTLEDYVASIEDSLSTLRSRSAIIVRFSMTINQPQNEGAANNLESHLHDWLSLIMKNYVKEIDLRVSESPENNNIFYTLPQSVFTSKSLAKLQLTGCKFPTYISFCEFLCLKEIILEDIVARDDQIQDLLNHSKDFLEKLTIKTFPSIELLTLKFFPKLVFLEVNVMRLIVDQAMNLDTVVLYGILSVCGFCVWNIKTLKFLTWNTNVFNSVKEFISSLPFLETVQLYMTQNEHIRIDSPSLKTLFLFESQRFEETISVEVDASSETEQNLFHWFFFPCDHNVEKESES